MSYLTPFQCATKLSISSNKVRSLVKSGKLSGIEIDGQCRIDESSLDALINQSKKGSNMNQKQNLRELFGNHPLVEEIEKKKADEVLDQRMKAGVEIKELEAEKITKIQNS